MKEYFVDVDIRRWSSRDADPNDSWDRGNTDGSATVRGVHASDQKGRLYENVPGVDANVGETVHLLYAMYSTGDSFGNDDGNFVAIAVFKNAEAAIQASSLLEDGPGYMQKIMLDASTELEVYKPWVGYFESLENLAIFTTTLQP